MKIRIEKLDDPDYDIGRARWVECDSEFQNRPFVEIPDAVVKDWRDTLAHLAELEAYFDEKATPQIEAQEDERRKRESEEWERTATPEQREMREMQNAMLRRWSQYLFDQVARAPHCLGVGELERKEGDVVVYQSPHLINVKPR